MLYAFTVFALVYCHFETGNHLKVPRPAVFGRLILKRDTIRNAYTRQFHLMAMLMAQDGTSIIPPLWEARVERITDEGIVIFGTEKFPPGNGRMVWEESCSQKWSCRISNDDSLKHLVGTSWPGEKA